MAYDYAGAKATADRLIARFGFAATLRRPAGATGPAYNPTPGAPIDYPVIIAPGAEFSAIEIDGQRIQSRDRRYMLARGSLPIEPTTGYKLVVGSTEYSIQDVTALEGAEVIYWTLHVRR